MSNTDNNFDADTEQLDGEFDQPEQNEEVAPPAAKKSGGSGKFIVIALVLVLGGAAGAAKMGLLNLPIPGLASAQPAAPAKTAATNPPQPAAAEMPAASPAAPAASTAALPPAVGTDAMPPAIAFGETTEPAKTEAKPAEAKPVSNSLMPPAIGAGQSGTVNIAPPEARTGIQNPMDSAEKAPEAPADPFAKSPVAPAIAAPTTAVTADPLADAVPAPAATTEPAAEPAATAPAVVAVVAPAASDAKVEALEKRIDTLEQTIADLKAGMVKKSDLDSLKANMGSQPAARAHTEAVAVGEEAAPAVKKPAARKAPASHVSSSGKAAVSSRWVLKSAKPGMAWVALPGSSEIKTISVGDSLAPIGKITAIGKDAAGRWSVTGTRGKINQ